jgi:hypothetical protein
VFNVVFYIIVEASSIVGPVTEFVVVIYEPRVRFPDDTFLYSFSYCSLRLVLFPGTGMCSPALDRAWAQRETGGQISGALLLAPPPTVRASTLAPSAEGTSCVLCICFCVCFACSGFVRMCSVCVTNVTQLPAIRIHYVHSVLGRL